MVDDPINGIRAPVAAALPDRRRPGRLENVAPSLLSLLRDPAHDRSFNPETDEEPDQLSAMRGILLAVLVSLPVWVLVGVVIFVLI
jgi:hypothetical protein